MKRCRDWSYSGAKAAKLQRLDRFRRALPHVSGSALSAIVAEARAGNLPEGPVSRRELLRSQHEVLNKATLYGTLGKRLTLTGSSGDAVEITFVCLHSFLQQAFTESDAFREFIALRHGSRPSSPDRPWRLIYYADEYNPGLELIARHARKQWMTYTTFAEFGAAAIEREECWITISAALTSIVDDKIQSGYSQLAGRLLRHIFCGNTDPQTAGVVLNHGGNHVHLFFCLGGVLMDGLAHKIMWGTKGDNATRLCMKCVNLFAKESAPVSGIIDERGGDYALTCNITDTSKLIFATDEQVYGTVDRLARFKATEDPDRFKLRQQAAGFNHLPCGVLNMPELRGVVRPVLHAMTGFSHTLHIGGVMNTLIYLYLDGLYKNGAAGLFQAVHGFLETWSWPLGVDRANIIEIFSRRRVDSWRKAGHVKCQASELVLLIPVLAYWATEFAMGRPGTDAFLAGVDVHEAASLRKTNGCSGAHIQACVKRFLAACVAAGWEESMHPKFHWLVHLSREQVVSALVCESKHKVPKAYAKDQCNLTGFDESVLANVTGRHLWQLGETDCFNFETRLEDPREAPQKLRDLVRAELRIDMGAPVTTSNKARLRDRGSVQRGDLVLVDLGGKAAAAKVVCLWDAYGVAGAMLRMYYDAASWRERSAAATWTILDASRIPSIPSRNDIQAVQVTREVREQRGGQPNRAKDGGGEGGGWMDGWMRDRGDGR